jgi:hydroxylamine reductase (hybrid-cluster protein)
MTVRSRPTPKAAHPARQRGITLLGLVFWAVLISMSALLAMRVLPTVNEFATIKRVVTKVAAEGGSTVTEVRAAFERAKSIEYAIQSISGKDLEISKENDRIVVGFAYDKEIELFGPVSLLIKYRGRSQ